MNKVFKRLIPRLSIVGFVFLAVFVDGPQPSFAALPCGAQPEQVPGDVAAEIKNQSKLILENPASSPLRGLVLSKRRDLRQKYAEMDPSTLDGYLLWVTCQSISSNVSLGPKKQFDAYSDFYRMLSEPIAKVSPHPE